MNKVAQFIGLIALLLMPTTLTTAEEAKQILSCGDWITTNFILTSDIGPCPGDGIIIGADDITIDGNGYRILGTGNGIGIYINGHSNVTIRNFIISDFGTGVMIINGTGNMIISNTIHSNDNGGVIVFSGTDNEIRSNSIYLNSVLGIDLGGDGVTPNDVGDIDGGPNNYQNYPDITSAIVSGDSITISGTLNSSSDTSFWLQFFGNSQATPSNYGEGESLLGEATVTTNATGDGSFLVTLPLTVSPVFVTATATDPANNTSEFSECFQSVHEPICYIEPTILDFDTVVVGSSKDTTFTITNIGDGTLSGTISEVCDYFDITSGGGAFSIGAGETDTIKVRFEPTAAGTHLCTIETGTDFCADVGCTGFSCPQQPRLYVDIDATGVVNGSSWLDAYTDLQEALLTAALCNTVREIWVAEGTYMPTNDTTRAATFQLHDSLAIYGGFSGTETIRSERDWEANVTILSGDIGIVADSTDNCYHVVTGSRTNSTAVLDGFTITDGNADGESLDGVGGGMLNGSGAPTVANVTFLGNAAVLNGGGMFVSIGGNPNMTNVRFEDNSAGNSGGGMFAGVANVTVVNGLFVGNNADRGGAIYNNQINTEVLTNVTFADNSATWFGGAIYNLSNSHPSIVNSIMWGNTAPTSPQIDNNSGSTPIISYSLIEGCGGSGEGWDASLGTDGGNNIDADPMFKGTDFPNAPHTIYSSSPAINAGENSAVPSGVTADLDGNPRIYGAIVDMGAYEYQGLPTGVDDVPEAPEVFALHQNHPNPFNPSTTISFVLPERQRAKLSIYDVVGQHVCTLVDDVLDTGIKSYLWDGRNEAGQQVGTGIYFYRLQAGSKTLTKKMVFLK